MCRLLGWDTKNQACNESSRNSPAAMTKAPTHCVSGSGTPPGKDISERVCENVMGTSRAPHVYMYVCIYIYVIHDIPEGIPYVQGANVCLVPTNTNCRASPKTMAEARIPQLEKSWFVELFGTKDQIGICNLPDRVKKTPQLGATT